MERKEVIARLRTYRDLAQTNHRLTVGAVTDETRERHPEFTTTQLELFVQTNFRVATLRGKLAAIDFALELLLDEPNAAEIIEPTESGSVHGASA